MNYERRSKQSNLNRFKNLTIILIIITAVVSSAELDASFGIDGIAITDIQNGADYASCMVNSTDGLIVIGGTSYNISSKRDDLTLVRFTQDGLLDHSFGTDGIAIHSLQFSASIHAISLLDNGGILVAGRQASNFFVARFNDDGSLDETFGREGINRFDRQGGTDRVNDLWVNEDGSFWIVGYASTSSYSKDMAIIKCKENGFADSSFNSNGVKVYKESGDETISAIVGSASGTFFVCGESNNSFFLGALSDDGIWNTTFGINGKAYIRKESGVRCSATSFALDSKGRFVLAGSASGDWGVARFTKEGHPDTSFGINGFKSFDFGSTNEVANDVYITANDEICIIGYSASNQVIVLSLDENGDQKKSNAVFTFSYGDGASIPKKISPLETNNAILIGGSGSRSGTTFDFAIAKVNLGKTSLLHHHTKSDESQSYYAIDANRISIIGSNGEFSLYNAKGQQIQNGILHKKGSSASLATGMYLLKINQISNSRQRHIYPFIIK